MNEQSVRDKIYVVHGIQVMLDFELAEIYGYTTKAFNQQVKNNIKKFDDDFRFQLTWDDVDELSRSKKLTLIKEGRGGNIKYLPWAFTESGIYMLMTVLKGDLATQQSKALIRTFRAMKDYIIQNQSLIEQHKYLRMLADTQKEVSIIRRDLDGYEVLVKEHDDRLAKVMEQLSDTVHKSELSPIMQDFSRKEIQREYLFLDGQPMKADAAYIGIYAQAKKTICIVDDYPGTKTLHLLQDVRDGVKVTIFSDNKGSKLSLSDYQDFQMQFPGIPVSFIKTENKAHDRFIVLDYDTDDERVFHCGSSVKDAGKKLSALTEFSEGAVKQSLHDVITKMLRNPVLSLN